MDGRSWTATGQTRAGCRVKQNAGRVRGKVPVSMLKLPVNRQLNACRGGDGSCGREFHVDARTVMQPGFTRKKRLEGRGVKPQHARVWQGEPWLDRGNYLKAANPELLCRQTAHLRSRGRVRARGHTHPHSGAPCAQQQQQRRRGSNAASTRRLGLHCCYCYGTRERTAANSDASSLPAICSWQQQGSRHYTLHPSTRRRQACFLPWAYDFFVSILSLACSLSASVTAARPALGVASALVNKPQGPTQLFCHQPRQRRPDFQFASKQQRRPKAAAILPSVDL